jgi:L-asparaginase
VVLDDEIHAARYVRKAHTTSLGAFQSPGYGPVGGVTERRVNLWSRPPRRAPIEVPGEAGEQVPVALIHVGLGDDGRGIAALPGHGFRGVVVEAMGAGHVPKGLVEPLAALASEMPVVLTSRIGVGDLLRGTYGFPGSETHLLESGLISAGALDGLKARVQLTLLLMGGASLDEVREAFAPEGGATVLTGPLA